MIKIFITGGTGFFGKALLRHFQKFELYDLYKIYLFTRNISKFKSTCPKSIDLSKVCFFEGDILDIDSFPKKQFHYIIHAATDSTNGLNLNLLERSRQIIDGTLNVLEWCKNQNLSRLLYISSGGVYGSLNSDVSESETTTPIVSDIENTYSISKRFAEHLCFLYSNKFNFPVSIARCFSFIGEDLPLNAHFAIGNFIRNVIRNENIIIKGNGLPYRSYMDQRDLSNWLIKILQTDRGNNIYNIGSDEKISIKDLAYLINGLSENKVKIIVQNKEIVGQSSSRNYYIPNINKISKNLNLNLNFTLEDSIKYTILKNKDILTL